MYGNRGGIQATPVCGMCSERVPIRCAGFASVDIHPATGWWDSWRIGAFAGDPAEAAPATGRGARYHYLSLGVVGRAVKIRRIRSAFVLVFAAALVGVAASARGEPPQGASPPYVVTEEREPCANRDSLRRPFFGDLHVHTAFSQDASAKGTRNRPRDAYRFARGERLGIQPYDGNGAPWGTVQLARPLDFMAVTDHAELLGEVQICETPGLPGYDSWTCKIHRGSPKFAYFLMNMRVSRANPIRFGFCGALGVFCLEAALTPWTEIQLAAEAAYDRTAACEFTSFIGYEWTGSRSSNNLHRNVIFRNQKTVELPISFYEESRPQGLWRELREQCIDTGKGCEVIVIPHNSNLSNGQMFAPHNMLRLPFTADHARSRGDIERLVEIMQHKGDSECSSGVDTEDELCGFEKLSYGNLAGRYVPFLGDSQQPGSFVRNALKTGIEQEAKLGVNPFKLGIIAGTDTHVGTPGAVSETRYLTHVGHAPTKRDEPPAGLSDDLEYNPGGLAGIWAEENSRDALFAALHRREVFGTSGPRIPVRFFASWESPTDLCSDGNFVARGYEEGVPMGGDLEPPPSGDAAPRFAVWAARDPGTRQDPGTPLQRLQIIKGWVEDGAALEAVVDVAGWAAGSASVDPATCELNGHGADELCGVWVDHDFDASQHAFYYARVLENPSCRWNAHQCNALGVDCSDNASADRKLFRQCCEAEQPRVIQERAWSSPIWYSPAN